MIDNRYISHKTIPSHGSTIYTNTSKGPEYINQYEPNNTWCVIANLPQSLSKNNLEFLQFLQFNSWQVDFGG